MREGGRGGVGGTHLGLDLFEARELVRHQEAIVSALNRGLGKAHGPVDRAAFAALGTHRDRIFRDYETHAVNDTRLGTYITVLGKPVQKVLGELARAVLIERARKALRALEGGRQAREDDGHTRAARVDLDGRSGFGWDEHPTVRLLHRRRHQILGAEKSGDFIRALARGHASGGRR